MAGKPHLLSNDRAVADLARLYGRMVLIRRFEESLLELFSLGKLAGTTHTYIGQEANAVGVIDHLERARDVVVSNHRCHGHYLAFTDDADGLLGEVMGKASGVCGGKGGSQHLCSGGFYSNGVLGSTMPVATGMALAERERGSGAVTVAFIGDGTLGQGVVYESLNIASRWSLPLLVVVENNYYAQSTPSHLTLAGRIVDRGAAFGIETAELDTTDVAEVWDAAAEIVPKVRSTGRPFFLVLNTYRYSPHSKGDDNRDPAEIEAARQRDPLGVAGSRLPEDERAQIEETCERRLTEAIAAADASPPAQDSFQDDASPAGRSGRMRSEDAGSLNSSAIGATEDDGARRSGRPGGSRLHLDAGPTSPRGADVEERCAAVINSALTEAFETRDDVYLLGEDVLDPYGGAFKVTQGLSSRWPQRVITTPVSEGAIFGIAAGMALRGWRPVLEIMFGDFIALGFDQTVNGISKFRAMFDDQVRVPLVVRTPMGGRRGYGPTHSQTLEKLLLGVPGIKIVAPSECHDIGALLHAAIDDDDPVFFIENKLMYGRPNRRPASGRLGDLQCVETEGPYPALSFSGNGFAGGETTIVTYGGMLPIVLEAAVRLIIEDELFTEVVCLSRLLPLDLGPVLESVARTGSLVTVEEGTLTGGVGAEIAARVQSEAWDDLRRPVERIAARDGIIPAAPTLEDAVLPGVDDVVSAVRALGIVRS